MKKILLLAAGLVFGGVLPAAAQQCTMSKVQNSNGAMLLLVSGQSYTINPGRDRSTVAFWAPLDKVQVCRAGGSSYQITNLSRTPATTITALRRN